MRTAHGQEGSAGEECLARATAQEEPAITVIRKSLVAVGCTVVLAAGSTACGTEENLSAGQRLSRATDNLGEGDSISVQMSFGATPEQLLALSEGSDDPMPPEAAEFVSKMKVTFSAQSKKSLESSDEKDLTGSQLKVSGPDGDLIEYRLVDKTAYYRLDLEQFAKLSGEAMPPLDEIKSELPKGFKAAEAILAGKWVKIDMADLESLQRDMGAQADEDGPSGDPTLSAETSKKLLLSIQNAFAGQVTTKEAGRKDGADHVLATAPVRPLVTAIVNGLRPIARELPGGAKDLPTAKDLQELPNDKVTVDFALKHGQLSGATVDVAQFDKKLQKKLAAHGDGKLPVELAFGEPDSVDAPSDATKIDLKDLMTGIGSLMPGGLGQDAMADGTDGAFGDQSDGSTESDSFADLG
ncbi:hypothetical protein [Streptomyces zagrosensis]|uniref:Uncharacterized protein n=1 Tax=Streptomyces zagrosensis TaxID=1042984 RepID=A0A7W9V0F6_9ACTN|nr:hypothetical protein [Streptomyces zagrosensis]MBB5938118.1 hypothetical protein [Streptomyces zagrosensis]